MGECSESGWMDEVLHTSVMKDALLIQQSYVGDIVINVACVCGRGNVECERRADTAKQIFGEKQEEGGGKGGNNCMWPEERSGEQDLPPPQSVSTQGQGTTCGIDTQKGKEEKGHSSE